MSYNLMVFNKATALKTRAEFMQWYEAQTEWKEEHSYNDPKNTLFELRNWFIKVIQTFPDKRKLKPIDNPANKTNNTSGAIENGHFVHCSFYNVSFENVTFVNPFFKYNNRFKIVQFINCNADSITYAFLKNNQANLTGITLIEA